MYAKIFPFNKLRSESENMQSENVKFIFYEDLTYICIIKNRKRFRIMMIQVNWIKENKCLE